MRGSIGTICFICSLSSLNQWVARVVLYECSGCKEKKVPEMFWRSKKRQGPTKWCKACLWNERWKKINGRDFFSKKAQKNLADIYACLGEQSRIDAFIHEIEQAVIQKQQKNYNYVAIRLGRSIEFLTFVLCDFNDVQVVTVAKNLSSARQQILQIESKYASFVDRVGEKEFSNSERAEIRSAFKQVINNLVEFEIEIAGGNISEQVNEHTPPIHSLLRRVGMVNRRQTQAKSCINLVAPFMNEYRNYAAHADAKGATRQELSQRKYKQMLREYEEILSAFASLMNPLVR